MRSGKGGGVGSVIQRNRRMEFEREYAHPNCLMLCYRKEQMESTKINSSKSRDRRNPLLTKSHLAALLGINNSRLADNLNR